MKKETMSREYAAMLLKQNSNIPAVRRANEYALWVGYNHINNLVHGGSVRAKKEAKKC